MRHQPFGGWVWPSSFFLLTSHFFIGRGVMEEKYVLRLKVLEILRRYHKVQQHFHIMREWKKRWISPN